MDERTQQRILLALHDLARAQWHEFIRSPSLCSAYEKNLKAGRHKYVSDKITCGHDDCWSLYSDLVQRYKTGPIKLDCEEASTVHAAWLASQCYAGIYIGFVPGKQISHCVMGVEKKGKILVVDPSRWYGMGPTTYAKVIWRKLSTC